MPNNIKGDQEVQVVTWDDINRCTRDIALWIRNNVSGKQVTIYGVPRGGMIPAVMVSHLLEVEHKVQVRFTSTFDHLTPKEMHRLVVIDDICDSGDTFKIVKQLFPMAITVALFERKLDWDGYENNTGLKTYYRTHIIRNKNWIQFPWECE